MADENSFNVPPNHDQLPVGLRVLVVDDDPTVLKIIEQMSAQCQYLVTTCNDASVALNLLREKRDSFDVVISDVHMPNMDGFKFLHHVDQEFKVPVVLMSVDGSRSSVMEGIRHGACHYLIKPVHQDDIRNIWQHIVRKKTKNHNKEHDVGDGVLEYNDPDNHTNIDDDDDDAVYTCSVIDTTEGIAVRDRRKRSPSRERDDAVEIVGGGEDHHHHHPMPAAKKPRFVWTTERHQQFVNVVQQLGNKAVPKKILGLMNIPELTRENVASHLQKFRLQKKKMSKASMQALANADASRHASPQTQAQAQAGFHAAGNTWSISENHYSHSNNESSHGGTYTTAAPKYDSNNIPYPYYHPPMAVEDASPSSGYVPWEWPSVTSPCRFFQHHNNEFMHFVAMHQQQHHQQSTPPSSYIMPPPSQSQPYDETYNNNSYSFVGRNYSVIDQNTFSPQLLNNNNNNNNNTHHHH